ncbi:hypothetical protein [Gluconacetobacter tumulicola]|uniref:Uncharacterized protein n=1 Tax=Gluconacetobacter tumulicola TaxID=1017177 RepID=A0A7W4P8D2_9PROT|nr:hypothetical protein [Gluconacetobacter tumulicola]MBB2180869.1 hypothetical protein [Gluconacetobacter tumulicola]
MAITLEELRAKYNTTTTMPKKAAKSNLAVNKFIARCEEQIDFATQLKGGAVRPRKANGDEVHHSSMTFGPDGNGAYAVTLKYGPKTLNPFIGEEKPRKRADLDAVIEFYQDFIELAKSDPMAINTLIAQVQKKH